MATKHPVSKVTNCIGRANGLMTLCPRLSDLILGSEWASEFVTLCDSLSAVDSDLSDKLFITFLYGYLDFVMDMGEEIEVLSPDESFSFNCLSDCEEPSFA
jgi:hypothetical protein